MIKRNSIVNFYKVFILAAFFIIVSCGGVSSEVTIKGRLDGAEYTLILLREASHDRIATIDTARTDANGNFEFIINAETPRFILLQAEGEAEPIVLLVEPNDEVLIAAEKGQLATSYSVSGSKGSRLVRDLNLRLNRAVAKIDSLSALFRSSVDSANFNQIKKDVDSAYLSTIDEHRRYTVNFVKENRYSLAAILALYQQYDQTRAVLNKREDFELFKLVDSSLYPLYPNNPMVASLNSNVKKISTQLKLYDKRSEMLSLGQRVPNLKLPLVSSDTVSLWQVGKRYILLYFWATWCDDCAGKNIQLKGLYEKYASKGFEVIQIAVDDDKQQLLNEIRADSIPWLVATDFRQWESPILDSLSINSIPSNYLIDRNGIILERNISIDQLEQFLDKK
ncbi:MAG TPA: TlpA disulfide reductase family protein [Tenuifilaceae bacterium]|nr:TlpA disulfide reductase family protein [Tenuifilaceae bacterium]